MRVLLTGASGFVGSHILDVLCARKIPTAILLRSTSNRKHFAHLEGQVQVRTGSLGDPESLFLALEGITHVIHCAGCTKARYPAEYQEVNGAGTRNVVAATNRRGSAIKRLVHVSSLAASGPATAEQPARETDLPRPISEYGRSKLAGELAVRDGCQTDFSILRPPAVYGPRDDGFLSLFKAVQNHLLPLPSARQSLSLVYVTDLAEAAVHCLDQPAASRNVYFASGREVVTGRTMARAIANQVGHWTIPFPLPAPALLPVCLFQEAWARLRGKASLLNRQKYAELRAPGWVCDPSKLEKELGFSCRTGLSQGIAATLSWYRQQGWL